MSFTLSPLRSGCERRRERSQQRYSHTRELAQNLRFSLHPQCSVPLRRVGCRPSGYHGRDSGADATASRLRWKSLVLPWTPTHARGARRTCTGLSVSLFLAAAVHPLRQATPKRSDQCVSFYCPSSGDRSFRGRAFTHRRSSPPGEQRHIR